MLCLLSWLASCGLFEPAEEQLAIPAAITFPRIIRSGSEIIIEVAYNNWWGGEFRGQPKKMHIEVKQKENNHYFISLIGSGSKNDDSVVHQALIFQFIQDHDQLIIRIFQTVVVIVPESPPITRSFRYFSKEQVPASGVFVMGPGTSLFKHRLEQIVRLGVVICLVVGLVLRFSKDFSRNFTVILFMDARGVCVEIHDIVGVYQVDCQKPGLVISGKLPSR